MSQEKVEQYKAAKKTRKQDIAKEKKLKQFKKICWLSAGALVAAALVVALVITVINISKDKKQASEDDFRATDYVVNDMSGIRDGVETEDEAE